MKRISIRLVTTEKVQKWFCPKCGKYFTFRKNGKKRIKFSSVFVRECVVDFVQGRSSFAVIRQRKCVSVGTLSGWVNSFGKACFSPFEISKKFELRGFNKWSGILLLDGKYLSRKMTLLLAVDFVTCDVVSWSVVKAETSENYKRLIDSVEKCGYKIKALVSDLEPSILSLTRKRKRAVSLKGTRKYPRPGVKPAKKKKARLEGIPHQVCLVHVKRDIKTFLANTDKRRKQNILNLVHKTLYSKKLSTCANYKKKLILSLNARSENERKVAEIIIRNWKNIVTHHNHKVGWRRIPKDSNTVENVIAYLNQRLKTLRRLRSIKSASNITNLIIVNFRTKSLINTKSKYKRNKCPLALTTGKKMKFDWMELIKKPDA